MSDVYNNLSLTGDPMNEDSILFTQKAIDLLEETDSGDSARLAGLHANLGRMLRLRVSRLFVDNLPLLRAKMWTQSVIISKH